MMPLMNDAAIEVYERRVVTAYRAEERITGKRLCSVAIRQSDRAVAQPRHYERLSPKNSKITPGRRGRRAAADSSSTMSFDCTQGWSRPRSSTPAIRGRSTYVRLARHRHGHLCRACADRQHAERPCHGRVAVRRRRATGPAGRTARGEDSARCRSRAASRQAVARRQAAEVGVILRVPVVDLEDVVVDVPRLERDPTGRGRVARMQAGHRPGRVLEEDWSIRSSISSSLLARSRCSVDDLRRERATRIHGRSVVLGGGLLRGACGGSCSGLLAVAVQLRFQPGARPERWARSSSPASRSRLRPGVDRGGRPARTRTRGTCGRSSLVGLVVPGLLADSVRPRPYGGLGPVAYARSSLGTAPLFGLHFAQSALLDEPFMRPCRRHGARRRRGAGSRPRARGLRTSASSARCSRSSARCSSGYATTSCAGRPMIATRHRSPRRRRRCWARRPRSCSSTCSCRAAPAWRRQLRIATPAFAPAGVALGLAYLAVIDRARPRAGHGRRAAQCDAVALGRGLRRARSSAASR